MEFFHNSRQQKVEGSQPEDRKNVRRIDDKSIGSDAKDRRNRINRKNQIGHFHHNQHEKQQSAYALAVDFSEELSLFVMTYDRNVVRNKPNYRLFIGFQF